MEVNIKIRVYGLVQGVNYRTHTKSKAQELGISGIVRNEPDGSVYIEAEGLKEQIEILMEWCKQGSPRSKVEGVRTEEGEVKKFNGFEIKR